MDAAESENHPKGLFNGSQFDANEIDHHAEKKLVRKLDWCIIPVVMLLYLLSFLDR